MKIELPSDLVGALLSRLPASARERGSGFLYQDGELSVPPAFEAAVTEITAVSGWDVVPPVAVLGARRASLLADVDAEAERQRLRWITPGAGQAMTYARKVEEARRVENDADPQPDAYPMLAASLGIDGADLATVAATILAMDAAWGRIGGAIEARRLTLKRDIAQAADETALAAFDITAGWPDAL